MHTCGKCILAKFRLLVNVLPSVARVGYRPGPEDETRFNPPGATEGDGEGGRGEERLPCPTSRENAIGSRESGLLREIVRRPRRS